MYITSSTIPETENLIAYNPGHMNNSFPTLESSIFPIHYPLRTIRYKKEQFVSKAQGFRPIQILQTYLHHALSETHVIIVFL